MKKNILSLLIILTVTVGLYANNPVNNIKLSFLNKKTVSKQVAKNLRSIKICALRVSFQSDENDGTTGDGDFLKNEITDTLCNNIWIDPPPHNRSYFKAHIKSLSNYYKQVSRGNFNIDTMNSEIFPLEENKSFQLSHKMDYYHPFLEKDSIDVRLARLFTESIILADSDINYSDYDLVVIFHAGVGQDFSIQLDPTPYDIPSAYMNINDIRLGMNSDNDDLPGISVDNGSHLISDGIILPESQNHLIYDNWEDVFGSSANPCEYQMGLNGTFAFMVGFYLGLPGLYDTNTGDTGIGKFGLMDQGSANLNGLAAAVPTAWSRYFLGWVEPVVAGSFQEVSLHHAESNSDTLMWKIPINNHEYFLVENRYANVRPGVSLDSIQYRIYVENGEDEWPPLLPLIKDSANTEFCEETGVLMSMENYDVGLPGSGLLIWHIDENIINANLSDNTVNVDKENRGVDLEEGDGAQDLGYPAMIFDSPVDIGWFFDPWFAGNDGFWELNPDFPEDSIKSVSFTDYSNPSSRANDLTNTGIKIEKIGHAGKIMNFVISRENNVDNYPLATNFPNAHITGCDLDDTDNSEEFILITDSLYLYNSLGELYTKTSLAIPTDSLCWSKGLVVNNDDKNLLFLFSRKIDSTSVISYWEVSETDINLIKCVFIGDIRLTGNLFPRVNEILFGGFDSENKLFSYSLIEHTFKPVNNNYKIGHIAGMENKTFAIADDNILVTIDGDYQIDEIEELPGLSNNIVVGYINENNSPDIVVSSDNSIILFTDPLTEEMNKISRISDFSGRYPILSDIDADGRVEIIVRDSLRIFSLNENLVIEENFPVTIPNIYSTKYFNSLLFTTDIDGDGVLDIVTNIQDVGTVSYDYKGNMVENFPLVFANHNKFDQILINSSNGVYNLAINNDNRELICQKISDEYLSENSWNAFGGNKINNFYYSPISGNTLSLSGELLNKQKTFNWPNPVKGTNVTFIRYYTEKDCEIDIDIFDLAGDFITSFHDSNPKIAEYNEKKWNVSGVESGVYFAVVKAISGSETETKIVKIMVIK